MTGENDCGTSGNWLRDNGFWKVCEALDSRVRVDLLRHLMAIEKTEFPCVSELAVRFKTSEPTMSIHLRKLANVGLVTSKRADRCVYYRAFATTPEGEQVLAALKRLFVQRPDKARLKALVDYAHALSHERRHAIVRCLHAMPGLALKDLCSKADMPPPTVVRLLADLYRAHIADMNHVVSVPRTNPEATLLALTLR